MGKLRLFGHDWKVKYNKLSGASGNWDKKEILIGSGCKSYVGHMLFHEIIELSLGECAQAFYTAANRDPIFVFDHGGLDALSKTIYNSLADNGIISEKKIRKLIEEK